MYWEERWVGKQNEIFKLKDVKGNETTHRKRYHIGILYKTVKKNKYRKRYLAKTI